MEIAEKQSSNIFSHSLQAKKISTEIENTNAVYLSGEFRGQLSKNVTHSDMTVVNNSN